MSSKSNDVVPKKKHKTKGTCNNNQNQNGFPCNFCCRPKPYNSNSDIQKHYKSCHFGPGMLRKNLKLGFVYKSDVSFVCVICGKRLKSKNSALIHINRYHSDIDNENATSDNDIKIMEAVKNKKKQAGFLCYFCDRKKPFPKRRDILHHYGICHFAMLRKNLICGYIYRGPTQYVCIHCGKNSKSK
jgi:DNA-directed RNA polymerase subunit RPC12/RpoP